ncbi:MAG TPA: hypothetical protein ENJ42_00140 [Hellea balneolensis]|uniref:Na+-transporting NADH:ubiquinone oxidoreductase, subunit NqrB n=1 Tax=Hellea balneolensis TaxID=287478 RepID=A0A7C5QN69_9PROT|nr:hypothetical protein [Hellea balneolensis]
MSTLPNLHHKYGRAFVKWWRVLVLDPRHYQIAILSSLIVLGLIRYGFSLPWWHAAASIGGALSSQLLFSKLFGVRFDGRSPLISSLSLTLLLRTGSVWISLLAACLVVASKFLIRVRGKHVFNPANFAIVTVALLFSGAWVSPGQWGTAPILALWLAGLGMLVTTKAKSFDLTAGFLVSYAVLLVGRALYLGDPLTIPLHQFQSGALLIFAFFMISDPMTTPSATKGRLVYALCVAGVGFVLSTFFYQSAGVIYALLLCAPLVPVLDLIFPAKLYHWPQRSTPKPKQGEYYENLTSLS